jgi:heme oxygenase
MSDLNRAANDDTSNAIMTKLRKETRAFHSRLESMPFFQALMQHTLPLDCYVQQLRTLSILHGILEAELRTATDERVLAVWDESLRKLPLLESDLAHFAPQAILDAHQPANVALAMTEKIRVGHLEDPVTILGYLYVFEGSTLGNRMHQPDIAATFELQGDDGSRYYASYGDEVHQRWLKFVRSMNSALSDPKLHPPVISAAHQAFAGLEELYGVLYPPDDWERCYHATRINPEAGYYPIPQDKREIDAALRASERIWHAYPYFAFRYGEKGKRFTDSDTCWLATLVKMDQEALHKQVLWIARFLSTHGMPILLTEETLRYLYDELQRAVPEKTELYQKLLASAETLRREREAVIPQTTLEELTDEFDRAVGPVLAREYEGTGRIVAAALYDELVGVPKAVNAVREFLTDSTRFPQAAWVEAVNQILEKAQSKASPPEQPMTFGPPEPQS